MRTLSIGKTVRQKLYFADQSILDTAKIERLLAKKVKSGYVGSVSIFELAACAPNVTPSANIV